MTLAYTRNKVILLLFFIIAIVSVYLSTFTSLIKQRSENDSLFYKGIDLNEIKKRGKLIALTDNSSTSYYIYKGDSMGYEYELLKEFAKENDLELEMVIAHDLNNIFYQLNSGSVDIIAANLTVTKERGELVDFTEPLLYARQVLIQRKPDGWENMTAEELNKVLIRNVVDLSGKNVHLRKGSSFYSRLNNLSEEIGEKINITEVPGDYDTELLIGKVATGDIEYTIADENVALINQTYYSNIDIETPISFPQKIAWAVRKSSPMLADTLNKWIRNRKNSKEEIAMYRKYFSRKKFPGSRSESKYISYSGGVISRYDDLIKVYSEKIGWEWELLAALIYQESRFSPTAKSWAGASGLMQLIPITAKHYGLDTVDATAEQSLKAGTQFIIDLDRYWKKYIPEKSERIKFVLASYNAGLGHVIDSRNIAEKYGKDPNRWTENVEEMMLQKSNPKIYNDPIVKCGYCRGQETYNYVIDILARYQRYKKTTQTSPALVKN